MRISSFSGERARYASVWTFWSRYFDKGWLRETFFQWDHETRFRRKNFVGIRGKNFRLFSSRRTRPRSNHLFRDWWWFENGRGGEGQKSMRRRECAQPGRPPALSRLRRVPVIIGVSFSSRSTSPSFDIFVWQPYRARPAKKGRAVRVDAANALPPQIAARVFSTRVSSARKNVPVASRSSQFPKNRVSRHRAWRKRAGRKRAATTVATTIVFLEFDVKAFARSRLLCSTVTFYLSNGNSRVRAIKDSTDLETRELRNVDGRSAITVLHCQYILYAVDFWFLWWEISSIFS